MPISHLSIRDTQLNSFRNGTPPIADSYFPFAEEGLVSKFLAMLDRYGGRCEKSEARRGGRASGLGLGGSGDTGGGWGMIPSQKWYVFLSAGE